MIRLAPTRGQRVVDRDTAETLGKVKRVLVNARTATADAIEVDGAGDRPILPWSAVVGVGPDAVVVPGRDALRVAEGDREQAFLDGRLDVLGKRLLTDAGNELGEVRDVELDEGSGELEAFELDDGTRRRVSGIVAIGPYAVIVPAGTPQDPG